MDDKIDFVLIWVDGSDPKWLEEKAKYSDNPESILSGANRYRDWGLMKYWFRGVEKFAPWVNNIYFITCGHYPQWLNLNNPKLRLIKHEDYIPKEYLPTFNSDAIEMNFHRLEGLSEKFLYFNDDMFIINYTKKEDFFENNKPKHLACNDTLFAEGNSDIFSHILLNNIAIINKHFNKKEVIKKDFFKWFSFHYNIKYWIKNFSLLSFNKFSTLYNEHLPSPMLKSTIKELWEKEPTTLSKTASNKFRSKEDVNQYIFKWYDIARGNFEPGRCDGKYFNILNDYNILHSTIEKQKFKMICISDEEDIDFEKEKNELINSFEKILPEKSSFEI